MAPCLLWSNCPMWGSCQNILRWSPSKNYLCWLVRKIFDRCYLQEIFLSPVDWCKCCLTAFSLLTVHCLYSGIIIKYCWNSSWVICKPWLIVVNNIFWLNILQENLSYALYQLCHGKINGTIFQWLRFQVSTFKISCSAESGIFWWGSLS